MFAGIPPGLRLRGRMPGTGSTPAGLCARRASVMAFAQCIPVSPGAARAGGLGARSLRRQPPGGRVDS